MNSDQYLLLLGHEMPFRERAVVAALRVFSQKIVGAQTEAIAGQNKHLDNVLKANCRNPVQLLDEVKAFEKLTKSRPAAVVPLIEMSLEAGRLVADAYDLPYLTHEAVNRCRNKHKMKQCFLDAGLPTPKFLQFTAYEELVNAAAIIGFPCVLKPSNLGGSMGVIKVDNESNLKAAFEHVSNAKADADKLFVPREPCQIEEYFEATHEVSVEVINYGDHKRVLTVTDKYLGPPPFFAEIGHSVPSIYNGNKEICDLAVSGCHALGINRGLAHAEIRIGANGELSLIEIAGRPAGDGILDQFERVFGANAYELHIKTYLDIFDVDLDVLPPLGRAAVAFLNPGPGKVKRVKNPKDFPENLIGFHMKPVQIGEIVGRPTSYKERYATAEFYWPEAKDIQAREMRHIEISEKMASEIFELEKNNE